MTVPNCDDGEAVWEFTANRPQRNRKSVFKRLINLLLLVVFAIVVSIAALQIACQQFISAGPLKVKKIVTITRGSGTGKIAKTLERTGVISNAFTFQAGVYASSAQARLKAGDYSFEPGISMAGVMEKLISGKIVIFKITIPEGLTSRQIIARLMSATEMSGKINEIPAEGSLLPQTYNHRRKEARSKVLERMRDAQKKLLEGLWPRRAKNLPITTPDEAIILASIVEKETGIASERQRVAGVFVNRLRRSMRLQSDPTVIYGLVGGKGKLGRSIRRSELERKTPYNTYKIDGLTPTPISNPGEAAIAAVLNPLETDEFYFVADGKGGHAFSKTLKEHETKVLIWRKAIRKRKAREKLASKQGKVETPMVNKKLAFDAEAPVSEETAPQPPMGVSPPAGDHLAIPIPIPRPKPRPVQ